MNLKNVKAPSEKKKTRWQPARPDHIARAKLRAEAEKEEQERQEKRREELRQKLAEKKKQYSRQQGPEKAARKSAPAACGKYDEVTLKKLFNDMTAHCAFCKLKLPSRPEVRNHTLFECQVIHAVPELHELLTEMKNKRESRHPEAVLPTIYRYDACPLDGLHFLTTLTFPPRVYIAPPNYLYVYMDASKTKGEKRLRRSALAQTYEHSKSRERRRGKFTDRNWHLDWEQQMKELIRRGQVDQLLIMTFFWYTKGKLLTTLDDRNHCALITLNISGNNVVASYRDSIDKTVYANAAGCSAVQNSLKDNLIPRGFNFKFQKEDYYGNVAGNGCQGVVAFWVLQALHSLQQSDPPNVESVEAMKGLLCHPPIVRKEISSLKGEEFDLDWDFVKLTSNTNAEPDDDDDLIEYFEEFEKRKNKLLKN